MTTLAKAKARANETFIVQVSLTIVKNIFIEQAIVYFDPTSVTEKIDL